MHKKPDQDFILIGSNTPSVNETLTLTFKIILKLMKSEKNNNTLLPRW